MATWVAELTVGPAGPSRSGGTHTAPAPVAEARDLSRSFEGRTVLSALDLEIAAGEFVALLGRSGEGKSTLLRAIAGLDREVTGEVAVHGTVAVAFQDPRLLPWKTVLANVGLGLRVDDPQGRARGALEEVGLTSRQRAWPLTLSGGEAQRALPGQGSGPGTGPVAPGRAVLSLDALTRMAMHDLVLSLWACHQPAVLMVTHDVDEALVLADRVLVLRAGRLAFESPVPAEPPRHRDRRDLLQLRRQLLAELGVDQKGTK